MLHMLRTRGIAGPFYMGGIKTVGAFIGVVYEPPVLEVPFAPPEGQVGLPYLYTISFSNADDYVLNGTLPAGLSHSGGTISGIPTVDGSYAGLSITATNKFGSVTTSEEVLVITP